MVLFVWLSVITLATELTSEHVMSHYDLGKQWLDA